MLYWEGHACYTGRGMGGMPTQVLTYYQLRLFWRVGRLSYVPTYVLMYHSCAICVPDSCTHSMYLCAHSMYLCTHSIYFSCAPVHSPCDVPTHDCTWTCTCTTFVRRGSFGECSKVMAGPGLVGPGLVGPGLVDLRPMGKVALSCLMQV